MKKDTSATYAARRRLALLALLHQRPHSYQEIVAALDQKDLFIYDRAADAPTIARLQKFQFRNDLKALKQMECVITHMPSSKRYTWHNSPFKLSLSQEQSAAFGMLFDTFSQSTILHADAIQAFLAFLLERLPPDQQKVITQSRHAFHIDLRETTDYRTVDAANIQWIEKAIETRQQLEFDYRATHSGKVLHHIIEPASLTFERGHIYLHGWSLDREKELPFRLDNILAGTARMRPIAAMHGRPSPRKYALRYRLNAIIARNSVSEHFPDQQVERHPDGSATVTAHITDLFEARRLLLSYGKNCVVLEPPALVAEMQDHAAGLYEIYHTAGE